MFYVSLLCLRIKPVTSRAIYILFQHVKTFSGIDFLPSQKPLLTPFPSPTSYFCDSPPSAFSPPATFSLFSSWTRLPSPP